MVLPAWGRVVCRCVSWRFGVMACRGATHVVSVFEPPLSSGCFERLLLGGRFEWLLSSGRFEWSPLSGCFE
jgi:hypothetical protein